MKDSNIGLIHIADYILYQLNKTGHFDYVEHMNLTCPIDDGKEMLKEVAFANDWVLNLRKAVSGIYLYL